MAYAFYTGEAVDAPDLDGPHVDVMVRESILEQASAIASRCAELIKTEKVEPSDIVVLVAKRPKAQLQGSLNRLKLPNGVRWTFEQRADNAVLVETVGRFKGLEAPIVILWAGDEIIDPVERETAYVGTSRANYLLVVVGSAVATHFLAPNVKAG
ncbi:ATP-binding domain-containing protein [Paraburkholderia sp. GAS32]|uniref:ATP-binding domain-containing protein n=1 Tax=Paraburkholderia sp. GAS32 TaxID=3035129 RepID=UPI003D22BD01